MSELATIVRPPPGRRIFCNRTLNLRAIRVVGFDMDYTLVHYRPEVWEERAYEHARARLSERGWPVAHLSFDPEAAVLGLVIDLEQGNLVKANRFGYIKQACHGTRPLSFEEQRRLYARERVDLSEPRWVFLNTLFSLSEACLYAQLVDLCDAGQLPPALGYGELYRAVKTSLDEAHMEGRLKAEIIADPDRFVVLDEELPLALQDLRHAGKRLVLITNSEWDYTQAIMSYALDRFLPRGMTWRELFDLRFVLARKPEFFTHKAPVFEVVDEAGRLLPRSGPLREGATYVGGHAGLVEAHFGVSGEDVLYIGDHIFADVHVSKSLLRWRTALVLRALEDELAALEGFKQQQAQLSARMAQKERLEHRQAVVRLLLQRQEGGYGPPVREAPEALREELGRLRAQQAALDAEIAPLAQAHAELHSRRWGLLMRTGNDKSHLARQIERYADVYMSRVSNLLWHTPYAYLRSPRGSLPHDSGPAGGVEDEA